MLETASEIVIWMVLAALVGFATGWALRSVVANRARARLSERLEEKRREAQDLREELRHLRGDDDEDVMHVPGRDGGADARMGGRRRARGGVRRGAARPSATAEHDEVELGPLDEPDAEPRTTRRRRHDARDAPRRGGVGGRGGAAAQARRRGVERAGPVSANRDELSPLALLRRSAAAYPDRLAVRDGERTLSFAELAERAWRARGRAARARRRRRSERVAMLSLNRSELLEAHFGVPACRAARCAPSTRASPRPEVRFIVEHCGAQVLLLDPELEAAASRGVELPGLRVVRLGARVRGTARGARPRRRRTGPTTRTGRSRSTTRAARRARRRASSTRTAAPISARSPSLVETRLGPDSSYLWTLPMFHCNGWCFSWAVAGVGATSVVLRRPEPRRLARAARRRHAPVRRADGADHAARARRRRAARARRDLRGRRRSALADADRALRGGRHPALHMYGLTETYGPATVPPGRPSGTSCPPRSAPCDAPARACRPCSAAGRRLGSRRRAACRATATRWVRSCCAATRHGRLPRRRRGHRRGLPRRLAALGRCRRRAPRRAHRAARPLQGRDRLGRREHLDDRGRAGARAPSRGARLRGRRHPGRSLGRATQGLRRAARRAPRRRPRS